MVSLVCNKKQGNNWLIRLYMHDKSFSSEKEIIFSKPQEISDLTLLIKMKKWKNQKLSTHKINREENLSRMLLTKQKK